MGPGSDERSGMRGKEEGLMELSNVLMEGWRAEGWGGEDGGTVQGHRKEGVEKIRGD